MKQTTDTESKPRDVFVIMPFTATPSRSKDDLTAFFDHNLKKPIESHAEFRSRYVVSRSADQFCINETILHSLYAADIVICDLSGAPPNPNVMFELGIRLSVSERPVIMIREEHSSNQAVFDVSTYYVHLYSPLRYAELEEFLIKKITDFENGELFSSPVLTTLKRSPSVMHRLEARRAHRRICQLRHGVEQALARLAGETHSFIAEHRPRPLRKNSIGALYEFLIENRDELRELPWPDLPVGGTRIPMLEAYLAEPVPDDIIPGDIAVLVAVQLQAFFYECAQAGNVWHPRSMDNVIVVLHEMQLWVAILSELSDLVKGDATDPEGLATHVRTLLGRSVSSESVRRQWCGLPPIEEDPESEEPANKPAGGDA